MNGIKAIIFDMDGIIVDSEPMHFEAHKKSLAEFGFELSREEYLDFGVAAGDASLYKNIVKKYPNKPISIRETHARKKEIYKELVGSKLNLRENIAELLSEFKSKYKLAIASSGEKEIVMFVLEKFNIKNYFDIIVTGGDIEKPKPAPDAYLKVIENLGLSKENCVAIEDSETGLNSAKAAGLKCVAIPCEFTKSQNFSKADVVIDSLDKLSENISRI